MYAKEIRHAITPSHRLKAIGKAKDQFNHSIPEIHDIEIETGAANALCIQLGYSLNKKDDDIEILNTICCALELVYQCSISIRTKSFRRIGFELIPLLIKSMERCRSYASASELQRNDTVLQIMKILNLFSAIELASNYMATSHGVLSALVTCIQNSPLDTVKLEAISTCKNISLRAEEHRINLVEEPHFISSIVELSYGSMTNKIREDISEIIRNLALALDAKITMAQQGILLNAIINHTDDSNKRIKFNAVVTLGSLAVPPENSHWLVSHSDGALVDILVRLINDEDPNIQERALKTLKRMGRRESVPILVDHKGVLDSLSSFICSEAHIDVRIEAMEVVSSFLTNLKDDSPSRIEKILKCELDLLEKVNNSLFAEAIFKSLMEASTYSEIASLMVKHVELLSILSNIIQSDSQPKSIAYFALKTVYNISSSQIQGPIVSSERMLASLTRATKLVSEDQDRNSYAAAEILVMLTKTEQNRIKLAGHEGLLEALMKFVTNISGSNPTKEMVKTAILDLVPLA